MLAFLTCRDEVDVLGKKLLKDEIVSVEFHSQTSVSPASYAVSVPKNSFAAKLISRTRVFALNFLPEQYSPQFYFCLRHSGEHMDKFKETGFVNVEAEKIECPRIKQADAFLECEATQITELNDYVLVVAKVLNHKTSKGFEVLKNG